MTNKEYCKQDGPQYQQDDYGIGWDKTQKQKTFTYKTTEFDDYTALIRNDTIELCAHTCDEIGKRDQFTKITASAFATAIRALKVKNNT